MNHLASSIQSFAFRALPHEDLKKSILNFAKKNGIKAGAIVTAVGSLEQINLRFANQKQGVIRNGHYEIVSLVGTFSDLSCHLHLSVSDTTGQTCGGHLLDENLIYTTAEIVLLQLSDLEFDRMEDPTYGFKELVVTRNSKK